MLYAQATVDALQIGTAASAVAGVFIALFTARYAWLTNRDKLQHDVRIAVLEAKSEQSAREAAECKKREDALRWQVMKLYEMTGKVPPAAPADPPPPG